MQAEMTKPTMVDILTEEPDAALLEARRWHVRRYNNNLYYAQRTVNKPDGRRATQYLHRVILSRALGRELATTDQVDHINGNGLDNRRSNLRLATKGQNMYNQRPRVGCSSVYKGVYWNKRCNKWQVQICFEGKRQHLGHYRCEIEAAKAYNDAAIELFGEFARPNVIVIY